MRVLPFEQYIIRADSSGRLAKRGRKFIRAYVSAGEKDQLRFGVDSAWGARDHRNQSADSNASQNGGHTVGGTETQDTTRSDQDSSSEGRDREVVQLEIL